MSRKKQASFMVGRDGMVYVKERNAGISGSLLKADQFAIHKFGKSLTKLTPIYLEIDQVIEFHKETLRMLADRGTRFKKLEDTVTILNNAKSLIKERFETYDFPEDVDVFECGEDSMSMTVELL